MEKIGKKGQGKVEEWPHSGLITCGGVYTLLVATVFGYLSWLTITKWYLIATEAGHLNSLTVTAIITGMKPLLCIAHMTFFAFAVRKHQRVCLKALIICLIQHLPS
jgi:hypothetical protein